MGSKTTRNKADGEREKEKEIVLIKAHFEDLSSFPFNPINRLGIIRKRRDDMNVKEAIEKRREITNFLDKEIPKDILENVLDAAYKAPAGNNLLSREFILVTKRENLDLLSSSTPFVPWLKKAKAAIVVTGRPDISKYWVQDGSIASGYLWLAAVENGLGAAFGAIYHATDEQESEKRESYVKKTLQVPDDRRILSIIGFGYPDQNLKPKKMLPRDSVVYYETF